MSSEEATRFDEPLRFLIPIRGEDVASEVLALFLYLEALYAESDFQWELEKLSDLFPELALPEDRVWAEQTSQIAELLSRPSEESALQVRSDLTPFLTEQQVRLAFHLKRLAERWGLGSSIWAVQTMARMMDSVKRGDEAPWIGISLPGQPRHISFPAMDFEFDGNPSWTHVWEYVTSKLRQLARGQYDSFQIKTYGKLPEELRRDAKWYAMHKVRRNQEESLEDTIWDLMLEWNQRHPHKRPLGSDRDYTKVRKAIDRFRSERLGPAIERLDRHYER